ncbi:Putative mutator sub-class protein [Arachis hypogaea]|nr:Putative mutator sub-class protein [Arachis hypogaea]
MDRELLSIFIRFSSTLAEIKLSILRKLGACGTKWVKKLFYKIPIADVSAGVRYETFAIGSDEDLQVLFYCRRSFSEVRIPKLLAKLEDGVDSSGASTPNPQSTMVGGASTSMPVVAAAVLIPDPQRVAAVHAGVPPVVSDFESEARLDRVENAMRDDDSDDEPVYLHPIESKEEVVLSIKDYSIQRRVEYRVMQSDHLKYQGICKEFGNRCTLLIRITLRKQKSTWKVRRYNGPHTCMATSISSDHKQLDYHVICPRIFPLVRADVSVTIKVLQEAVEATYGFRTSYRKVWFAKQKTVAQIYGDWEESYGDLPCWILGVTSTMDGSVAQLKTSPIRGGDQVNEARVYYLPTPSYTSPCTCVNVNSVLSCICCWSSTLHEFLKLSKATTHGLFIDKQPKLKRNILQCHYTLSKRHMKGVRLKVPPLNERTDQELVQPEPMAV